MEIGFFGFSKQFRFQLNLLLHFKLYLINNSDGESK